MRRNDTALYIFVGLIILGICSLAFEIKTSVIAGISTATLVFSIAQVIEVSINNSEEDMKKAFEVYSKIDKTQFTEEQIMFGKVYLNYFDNDKKKSHYKFIARCMYCIAFALLFLGFVYPVVIPDNIIAAVTIFSASIIFFSMWMTEKNMRKTEQWDEVMKLSLMQNGINDKTNINETMPIEFEASEK